MGAERPILGWVGADAGRAVGCGWWAVGCALWVVGGGWWVVGCGWWLMGARLTGVIS